MENNDKRVRFFRGKAHRYILEGGVPREGADVAFKPQFINALYFDTEHGVIYMNGKKYGFSGEYGAENSVFFIPADSEVTYSSPSIDYGASLTYIDEGSNQVRTIQLYRLYSGTPSSLKIDIDDERNYRLSLNLEESMMQDCSFGDNLLVSEGDKVGLYLGIKQDTDNGRIRFGSFDNKGKFNEFGSIEDTEFLKKSWLNSVGVVKSDMTDSSVLRFIWGDETVVDIPLWDIKKYKLNGIELTENSIIEGKDISVGESDIDGDNLDYSSSDTIADALKKIDIRLNNIENNGEGGEGVVMKDYI